MTRELAFRQSLLDHFALTMGLVPVLVPEISSLSPSDFPAISISLGETTYSNFDMVGHATAGVQTFTLQYYSELPQRSLMTMLSLRSDLLAGIESFLNGSYIPPAVAPGDNYRISCLHVTAVLPATLNASATRFAITVKGDYTFTLF